MNPSRHVGRSAAWLLASVVVVSSVAMSSAASAAKPGHGAAHRTAVVVDGGGRAATMLALPAIGSGPYVALGDSYASGQGAAPYDAGTDTSADGCRRSANAYPRQFSVRAGTGPPTQAACSGAIINDLYQANHLYPSEPGQLSRLSTADSLVTVTIGGNDAGFAAVMAQCVTAFWEVWLPSCQQHYTANDTANLDRVIDGMRARLATAYRDIASRAPAAAVWVVTYPRLLAGSCPLSGSPLRDTDAAWLNAEANHLADVTIAAATDAGLTGVLDERGAFAGHEVCTSQPWVNGYTWSGVPWNYTPGSFHPTASGYLHEAIALQASVH